jgi:hypothetical protein
MAEPFFDAADQEIHVGDRILIHGVSGYVRTIDELKKSEAADRTEYILRASHPLFGTWNDSVSFSETLSRIRPVYKSVDTSPYVQIGDHFTFLIMKEGEMTQDKKEGQVTELFSGGHMMIRTSWLSSVAISYRQLIYPSVSYVPEQPSGPPYSLNAVEEMVFQKYKDDYPHYNGSWEKLKRTILSTHKAEVDELFAIGRETH